MRHLILECPFSRQVWHEVLSWLRMTCRPPNNDASLFGWWQDSQQGTLKPPCKGLASITLLTPWMIWKHRNTCIFEHARPSAGSLVQMIKEEAAAWASAGAPGLKAVVSTTWDVH